MMRTSMGWNVSYEYCKNYIEINNGRNDGYFPDYKGGTVSIINKISDEIEYIEEVKN